MVRAVPGHERGQATVELVLVMPLIVLLVLAIVQTAVVARADVLVAGAARDAARSAAVDGDADRARDAAVEGSGLAADRLTVDVEVDDAVVRATVTYRDDTDVPLVGRLVGVVTLRSTVVMRRES
jgi:Flp pilus assembly protein TadG